MAYTEEELKKELETKEYEYGFYTDIESDTFPVGLNEDIIRKISEKKGEPEWMTKWRLEAFSSFKKMVEPDWSNVKYKKPDLQKISYYSAPKQKPKYNSLEEVDYEYDALTAESCADSANAVWSPGGLTVMTLVPAEPEFDSFEDAVSAYEDTEGRTITSARRKKKRGKRKRGGICTNADDEQ